MVKLTKEIWLEQGLLVLVESGIDAVTIDGMCRLFAVTKGSFYHHFKNREAYLEAMLQFWEETYTTQFIVDSSEGLTPLEQIQRLEALVVTHYGTAEVAIRSWAQRDPLAKTYLERVDQRRIAYLYQIQLGLHGDEKRARVMAHITYSILVGSEQIVPPFTREDLAEMYHFLGILTLKSSDGELS